MKKLNLLNITLVSMTSVNIDKTIEAMLLSSENINFGKIKLITHNRPDNLPEKIEFCYIDRIDSLDEYSYDMIYKLSEYIDTEFALIVQSDGYVLNANSWKDEFFDYDYVGAIWPIPRDNISFRGGDGTLYRVGNGGFSLRSKKLIDLPIKLKMKWESYKGFYNEDGFICVFKRKIYEENNCKFATIEVAKYFSHETELLETKKIIPFGFHGKNSKYLKK
jgi:hypothetical protein